MANCSQTNNTTIIGTSAVTYDSTPLPCTDVKACDDLNTILTKFDNVICSAINSVNILSEEVMNITEDLMIITEEIENINNQIFICCPICDFTATATELPVCEFTATANELIDTCSFTGEADQVPDPTTTTTSTSTSTSTTTTTTTIAPLNFDAVFACLYSPDSINFTVTNITGGVPYIGDLYLVGNIKFVSEAAALANTVWIGPTNEVIYGSVTIDSTWWLVVKDSVGNILAKSVTSNCYGSTTTTTSSSSSSTTTTSTTSSARTAIPLYQNSSEGTACDTSGAAIGVYMNTSSFITCTILYANLTGPALAAAGWYTDVSIYRYWDGSNFGIGGTCL